MSKYTGHKRELKYPIKALIVTVSTSRYVALSEGLKISDESGDIAEHRLQAIGIGDIKREIIPDDLLIIREKVNNYTNEVDLIIFIGGTGLTESDVTYEAIKPILDKELTLFPSLFALLSYEDVGTAVLASRVLAGIKGKTLIFCLPGSKGAVKLAIEKIIIPELGHLLNMLRGEQ